ncbi:hypothetical protein HIM_06207 [Hirsutella minnesotensis 3608]|uniref:F-box domain-containing protein n=1 Tax=Hirsutella minnesotensis 3608 TaxID=1043627 RepID=A0A0F7ZZK8_9HYPO|nr:hypothetical protein HIM_06207 [Hirsutella minnesotensis 3608]
MAAATTFTDLNADIIYLLIPDLDIGDILNCRNVSKSWRQYWDRDDIAIFLCRHHFPGLLDIHATSDNAIMHQLFLPRAMTCMRKLLVKPAQKSFISWQELDYLPYRDEGLRRRDHGRLLHWPDRQSQDLAFCDEMIAWQQKHTHAIVVGNLMTQTFQTFHPKSAEVLIGAVTKDLLVLQGSRDREYDRKV